MQGGLARFGAERLWCVWNQPFHGDVGADCRLARLMDCYMIGNNSEGDKL